MVTRKPVPPPADSGLAPYPPSPPYPITPTVPETSQSLKLQNAQQELRSSAIGSEPESFNAWRDGHEGSEGHPTANRNRQSISTTIPESLRVGPASLSNSSSRDPLRVGSADVTRASSREEQRPEPSSTNPFSRKLVHEGSEGRESSANAWGDVSELSGEAPKHAPPPIPESQPPIQKLSNLTVSEPSTNPWQPAVSDKLQPKPLAIPAIPREDSGNEAWSSAPPTKEAPAVPSASDTSQQPVLIDMEEPESPAWDEDEPSPVMQEMPPNRGKESQQISEDRHAWDNDQGHTSKPEDVTQTPFVAHDDQPQSGEGWNMVNHETVAEGAQQSGIISSGESHPTSLDPINGNREENVPLLPPRTSTEVPLQQVDAEHPPPQPPRPIIVTEGVSSISVNSQGPNSAVLKQKKETYEIKKISWYDVNAAQNPRISPILVQNLNGPCPLLALVNALTLSTPAGVDTALIETLRSREQVSLGLLLDAVFDELISGRRGDAAQGLPDVGDLYSFLITLHTGMNVNPRFFPPAPTKSSNDPRNSMSHVHPSEREGAIPGTFEDTRELKLYSTFSIPLLHGWLPEHGSPAYMALSRSAQFYEEAQNIMFNEEPLEDKLHHEGLSFEEQAKLEDIGTIKAFFASNATQLTSFGLSTITTSVAPGAVAILFRNDHFSTLYRHPETLQLYQLVTDKGYAGHEEVVWESLIDVNGENAEFFSGDFRLVGGALSTPAATNNAYESGDGWTTVTGRGGSASQNNGHQATPSSSSIPQNSASAPPHSPTTEQEDHDLALALQLQEEEEQRHEQELARRRRETELSQQYIEQSGAGRGANNSGRGNVPVTRGRGVATRGRGTGRGSNNESRPEIPPRRNNQPATTSDPEAGVDAPPPSYEQAANQPAYAPPSDHPAHPNASPVSPVTRRQSSFSATATQPQAGRGRRGTGTSPTLYDQIPSRPQQSQRPTERERDCTMM